jgi:prevent-host-death family protein
MLRVLQKLVITVTTMSEEEFSRYVDAAKRAAIREPVFITERGKPSHVLLSIDGYRRLSGKGSDVVERLSMDDDADFEPAPVRLDLRAPDL